MFDIINTVKIIMWRSRQLKKNGVDLLSKQECVQTRQQLTKHAVQAYRKSKLMFFPQWEEHCASKLLNYHHNRDQLAATEYKETFDIINQHSKNYTVELN